MAKDIKELLLDIMESLEKIQSHIAGFDRDSFLNDIKSQDAVVRRFEIIGEAVKNLPESYRNKNPSVPWSEIAGMRDVLIHEYFDVNWDRVWSTATIDVPKFKEAVNEFLTKFHG